MDNKHNVPDLPEHIDAYRRAAPKEQPPTEPEKECSLCNKSGPSVELMKCRECEELFCEDCLVPYDQFSQIDYCLCVICYECGPDLD